ncbi:MAG: M13 family metallopeptidase, partial [Bdellovibrionaceae bacterium]|nr:M13 family metallopeptidase [Pseudobdellovibrionaceae bacterium]
ADRERWTFSFTDIAERLLHGKKQFFKKIDAYQPRSDRDLQFKDVYTACMNDQSAANEERTMVIQETEKILGLKTSQDLANLSQERMDQGKVAFVDFFTEANKENPLKNDAFLIADARSLPERSYYSKKDLMAEFEAMLVDFFKTIKVDNPEKRAKYVVDFETALAKKYPLPNEVRERFTQKRDIKNKEYVKKYSNLKMDRFLERLPKETVLVDIVPESGAFINNAIKTMPLDQMKSVYLYHTLVDYLDDAYPEFFNKRFQFTHKYLGGPAQRPARQERCTKAVMAMFGMELDYELMNIIFPNFPQDKVVEVGESVRKSILSGLEKNTWLEPATRAEAIKKISSAKLYLVKPQSDKDWDFAPLQKYDPQSPHANYTLYKKAKIDKMIKELSEPRNPSRWEYMSPLVVNAYYNPPDNKFVLPMGILQFPFFDGDSSQIENIAAIGTVIGHELGHGIDDQGSQYDYSGKVRQWFTKKDLKAFKKHGDKFINQFNKIGHDGKLTLGENIGDHVGITFAYNAAFPDAAKATQEDKKKFFVAYARMWCNVATPSYREKQLKTDPHSLGRERINQQVIHIDGFYDAYNCKTGDKMFVDAKERIRIW